ncbi:MAG: DsbA family protein [Gammaproteobacteria bacterium]|nr:DsbA family protein [Gammaproteobacteria bacterium]
MKRFSIPALFLSFILAACGGGEAPVAEQPAAIEAPVEAVVETAPTADEPAMDEAQPEIVEESAAEEEEEAQADDQPIILAQAESPEADRDWQFTEGTHYVRMVPAQPTVGGADKIEVAELFWYGCNHCYDFEAFINRWKEDIPANVRFVRIPVVWNPLVRLHAQLYYTEEVLVNNGKIAEPETFRAAVFAEYHRRGNRLASMESIEELFGKHGVSSDDFNSTWNSFEVAQKVRVAQDLARRYSVSSVPTVVVNGKYRTGAGEAGGYPRLLELLDELIVRESIR